MNINTTCTKCGSEDTVKRGTFTNKNGDCQRFKCCGCGKFFSVSQALDGFRVATEKVALVVNMLCEGVGIRAAARLSGLSQPTVLKILADAGARAESLMETKLRGYKP